MNSSAVIDTNFTISSHCHLLAFLITPEFYTTRRLDHILQEICKKQVKVTLMHHLRTSETAMDGTPYLVQAARKFLDHLEYCMRTAVTDSAP